LSGITDESIEFFKGSGFCFDYSFLEPVKTFLENPDARTVYDVVDDGLEAFFKAQSADIAYYETDEAFKETSEANEWKYFQDGEFYSGRKYGAVEEAKPDEPEASKIPVLEINETWLHGKYLNGKAEINTYLPFVSFGEYFLQGDEADQAIKEIYGIWSIQDVTQEEALLQWANIWGLDIPE